MKPTIFYAAALIAAATVASAQPRQYERVRPNDNRASAGIRNGNTVALRMEARMAVWHPQGDDQPGAAIPVFAEIGRQAQVPGPLIRVPGGTDVIVVIRNAIPNTVLTVKGLHSRPAVGAAFNDSIQLAYGAMQTLRFRLDRPGTYYYWGTTTNTAFGMRTKDDAQLSGVIVVDEPGQRTPRDRIFVLGMWADTVSSEFTRYRQRYLYVINGRSWPHTDKLVYEKGETVRWRVVNATAETHPMHLHGFFFRVNRRGNGRADTLLARPELVTTERMPPGGTMSMTWVPERLGNWMFHCHVPTHIEPRGPLGYPPQGTMIAQAGSAHAGHNPATSMSGLVTAVEVVAASDDTTAKLPPAPLPPATRRVRLIMRENAGTTPTTPYFGVVLDERGNGNETAADRGQRVAPPLVLTKGEATSIMLVNRLSQPTSIHWHGMELESIYDGVANFSGDRTKTAPAIAPYDSFEVRMTPPRSGTFIYHSHMDEARQQRAGLAGALIVVDKGKWDPKRDFVVLASTPSDSIASDTTVLVNGSFAPAAIEMRRGVANRLRLINITTTRQNLMFVLMRDSTQIMTWRPLAKDGADLPAPARLIREATESLGIGETKDFELLAPVAGEYRLELRSRSGIVIAVQPIRVQ